MHELSVDYDQNEDDNPNFNSPVCSPLASSAPLLPNVLKESIFYNSHVIPKYAEFKVQ
ncbi:MAG: hypothetical protein WCO84_08055 [bacterium]